MVSDVKKATAPLLPRLLLHPPHPLHSVLLELHPAYRPTLVILLLACPILSTFNTCLSWTLCCPLVSPHLHNDVNGSGNRSEEQILWTKRKNQNAQQLVSFLCRLWIFCGVTLKPRKVAAPTPSEVEAVTLAQTSPRNCCCNTDCSCSSDPTSANRRDTSSVTVDRWTSGCAYCPNLDFEEVDDHM